MDDEVERLRSILDSVAEGVVAMAPSGRLVFANRTGRELLGAELVDRLSTRDVPAAEHPAAFGVFRPDGVTPLPPDELPLTRALRGQTTEPVDVCLKNEWLPQGRRLCVSGRPWRGSGGRQLGAVVVFHDVARRAEAEEALRTANLFLDSIIENVPTMIFVKDARDLRFERFNKAGEELLGLSRDVLLGKSDRDFFPPEQAEFFTRRDRETLAGKQQVDILEEPIDTARGKRWLYTKKVPLVDEAGEPRYLLGISLDITARKEAEAALQASHAELEERVRERTAQLERANEELRQEVAERRRAEEALRRSEEQLRQSQKMEAVGRLAGGVAHDFNNMLSVIIGYTDLISRGFAPGDPRLDDLQAVRDAADRAANLTRQLLAFSRKRVLQPVLLDLGAVVRGMEGLLRRLIGEDIDLRVVTTSAHAVRADPGQLEQVIMNLVVNARDAMPTGGRLTIEVGDAGRLDPVLVTERGPCDFVRLAVTDTGTGMTPETKAKLFEPFFTTKPRGKGTGLGLSTVFGIVKQSGGELAVQSEPGRGSTFEVLLPRVEEAAAVAGAAPAAVAARIPADRTILLVEDEQLVRDAALAILASHGCRVLVAGDPKVALGLCADHPGTIDLLLTDVIMPGMNGRELAERALELRPDLRVLFMSGYTEGSIAGVLEPGVEFVDKPFTPDGLVRRVVDLLLRR
jgi:two-component system, cell cycle sensor histidine kinase and response regulator CckA